MRWICFVILFLYSGLIHNPFPVPKLILTPCAAIIVRLTIPLVASYTFFDSIRIKPIKPSLALFLKQQTFHVNMALFFRKQFGIPCTTTGWISIASRSRLPARFGLARSNHWGFCPTLSRRRRQRPWAVIAADLTGYTASYKSEVAYMCGWDVTWMIC